MTRQPDPDSPAAAVQPEPGDCIADVDPDILERTGDYHFGVEPDGEPVDDTVELT